MSVLADGLRLAVGTLTVVPDSPPRTVGPWVAAGAKTLAPLAAVPVAAAGATAAYAGDALALPPLLTATVAVAGLGLASGALHLDGLADAADGLAVPGGRERRLEGDAPRRRRPGRSRRTALRAAGPGLRARAPACVEVALTAYLLAEVADPRGLG